MIYQGSEMEEQAVLQVAAHMCAAARTAPKAMGRDNIRILVLTGQDKDALADKMEAMGRDEFGDKAAAWYSRDASNVRRAQAVVLVGALRSFRGVPCCSFCGFENCAACKASGGNCAFAYIDLGIALSSAVQASAAGHVDNRIMFSIGKAAMAMDYTDEDVLWHGIPLSVSGKNIFMDRK